VSVAGDHLDEGDVERFERIEASARELVNAIDSGHTNLLVYAALVAQLRFALEGRASSSPTTGGGGTSG
jgi:hypothetical protein